MLNPVVPMRVRRTLNVESGLNDGLGTPVVLFAIAVLAGEEGLVRREHRRRGVELAVGILGSPSARRGGPLLGWSREPGSARTAGPSACSWFR